MEYGQNCVRLPKTTEEREKWQRLIVILEHCPLESVHTEKHGWELLSERHRSVHARRKTDPAAFRPDVVHQCLLHLLDSPLNRSGRLQIFLHSHKSVLLSVDPRLHVPRSYRLFEKMMTQALHKFRIRSTTNFVTLLKVVKNPITDHLPLGCRIVRVEKDGESVDPFEFARKWGGEETMSNFTGSATCFTRPLPLPPVAYVIGGMAKGDVAADYCGPNTAHDKQPYPHSISFGKRGMSAACVCSTLCHAYEELWVR